MKKCNKCLVEKPLDDFFKDKNHPSGRYSICKLCKNQSTYKWREEKRDVYNALAREWRKKNRHRNRQYNLKRHFGITPTQYEQAFEEQNGRCAICERHQDDLKKRLHIDHCHKTRMIRALLCHNCNVGLGNFQDDPTLLLKAVDYLEKNRESQSCETHSGVRGLTSAVNRPGL